MRLDKYLAEHYFDSRNKAARAIEKGLVSINGRPAKASCEVSEADVIIVREEQVSFVSEGGYKLFKALQDFSVSVKGEVFADLGASTGGFTDCLLQAGVGRVYAVDVGESLLAPQIQGDPRVIVKDRVNARYLNADDFPERLDGITVDLSFISLSHILPVLPKLLSEGGRAFVLIKPQFECGKQGLNKHGIVKDEKIRRKVIEKIYAIAESQGLYSQDITNAPLQAHKNIEYILLLNKRRENGKSLEQILRKAERIT